MIDNRSFDLTQACFDVNDKTLVPKAGACNVCPFNAANQGNLFGEGKMICTRASCFENKKTKTFMKLLKRVKKEELKLVPNISKYWADEERNQWVMAQMEKEGLEVHLTNELDILKEPIEPTMESIKEEHRHYEYTEEELAEFLTEALESFTEEKQEWENAMDHGFEKGVLLDTGTYLTQTIHVKVREEDAGGSPGAKSLEKRKMSECTPEEQIIKINVRELRKKEIEDNNQFKDVVEMIRETDYIDQKKALSTDEMVAISISLFENNLGWHDQREHFEDFFGDDSQLSREELVVKFKKDFKKETLNKLLRFLLTRQVHFGESNHTNDLTNQSFYVAMQSFYRDKIAVIEDTYAGKRQKREARIKERIMLLEQQAKVLKD